MSVWNPIPDCKQVLVPFNEDDYHKILVNTSQEMFNKLYEMWDAPVGSEIGKPKTNNTDIKYIAEEIIKRGVNEPLNIKYIAELIED